MPLALLPPPQVHTVQMPVTSGLNALYESADVDACVNLLGRVALDKAMASGLQAGLENLQTGCLEVLRAYRSLCPPHAKSTQTLLLPDNLKLLPLYTLGMMKSALFASGNDVKADERSALLYALSCAPVAHSTALVHPRLLCVFPPQQALPPTELPRLLPLTAASLSTAGAYLLEDGLAITLWLVRHLSSPSHKPISRTHLTSPSHEPLSRSSPSHAHPPHPIHQPALGCWPVCDGGS